MSRSTKRFRSLVVTIFAVAATNLVISFAASASVSPGIPDAPRPKSIVPGIPDAPRPKSVSPGIPDAPKPKSIVPGIPDAPRP